MSKATNIIMWSVNIIVYILNIVTVCVTGSTLQNNIMGWCCAIILAICIMNMNHIRINNNLKRWEYNNEQTTTKNEEH